MKKPVRKARSLVKPQRTLGRPLLFKPEYVGQVYKLCLLGATDVELAEFFNVSEVTLNSWKHQYPAFFKSMKLGKSFADAEMANKLYHRGIGYSHPEEKLFCYEGEVIRAETTKHYPPDTAAAFIWLKNRRPDLWRDRQEFTGPNGTPLTSTPPSLVINFYASKNSGDDAKLIEAQPAHR